MDWTWYLFRFHGRINRALFWQALLIVLLLAGLLGLIAQAIHFLYGQRSFTPSPAFSFDFDDLFKVVDPRTYRLLPSADRPTPDSQGVRHVVVPVDLPRDCDQAAA